MSKIHEIEYSGTIDDLTVSNVSVGKGILTIDTEEFKLKGHKALDEENRLTFHEAQDDKGIAVEIAPQGQTNDGEEGQIKIVKADGSESYVDAAKGNAENTVANTVEDASQSIPTQSADKDAEVDADASQSAPTQPSDADAKQSPDGTTTLTDAGTEPSSSPYDDITAPSKTHQIDYSGTVNDLVMATVGISKGILSIDNEDFKLKGHRKLNDANRLVFNEGPEGDISVDVLKRGHDNNGQEGEALIITSSGDRLYKDTSASSPSETAPTQQDTTPVEDPALSPTNSEEQGKKEVLTTVFVDPSQTTPDNMRDLVASNAGDVSPAEMNDVPAESTLESDLKSTLTATA